MPSTDAKNPMMKAFILLSTIWFGLVSFDLLNVNTSTCEGGKIIKAKQISTLLLFPPDSSNYIIVPEFRLTNPGNYKIGTVVIDPGHGGHDPGCLGHNSREKHIVLAIGNYLAAGLKTQFPGLNVIMTRSTDVFVPLHERASIATNHKADLFISIHCNAFPKSYAKGTETYVLGLHATKENLEVAKRENESILLEDNYRENYGYDPNSPEAHILFSMFQNAFLEQSIAFAEKVQGQAFKKTELNNRGVKQAGFLVLRYATMPSVLIETGYLTNSNDEAFLMTDAGQQKMAHSIQDAFAEYKREMEKTGAESAATVSYIEVKKVSPLKSSSPYIGPSNAGSAAVETTKKTIQKSSSVAKANTSAIDQKKATEKTESKPDELRSVSYPQGSNMNTSPKKHAKIAPTIPVNEPVVSTPKKETPTIIPIEKPVPKKPAPASNIQFCVQLAASPTLINVGTGKWTRITETVEVIHEAKLFKYQVRNFATLEEANQTRSALRAKGFNDAFVVAYKDGKRVDPRKLGH